MTGAQDDDLRELAGWKVLVIGLGLSGRSSAAFCAARGADVVAVDERPAASFSELDALPRDVEVRTGVGVPNPADFDLVVPSPGVPRQRYCKGAKRVWGDIELTARGLQVPLIAVTGTNGKSTTVRLIEAMLRSCGLRAHAAGNIGTPALDLVGEPLDVAVLEVSSFQLEAVESLRPKLAVILNVTPDHLDRHGSFDTYVDTKAAILAKQQEDDVAVLNFDDPVVRGLAGRTRARVIPVSRGLPISSLNGDCVVFDAGRILLRRDGDSVEVPIDIHDLPGLRGVHNLENVLASLAAVWGLGADPIRAAGALLGFEGLPHRCEEVARMGDVAFIDDSKATNAGAAVRSLESFDARVLWIAGGQAKGGAWEDLAEVATQRAREAFLIGDAAPAIEAALAGRIPVTRCDSIDDAVSAAAARARAGEVVLLAPACASFDQFASFEERGRRFAEAARSVAAKHSDARGDRA
jgi:UDP-N-acetylmuramoylalanine--D-glutamate ligase